MQVTEQQLIAHIKSGRYANHAVMRDNFGNDLDEFDTDPEDLDSVLAATFSCEEAFDTPKFAARLAELGLTRSEDGTFTFDASHFDEIADLAKSVIHYHDSDEPINLPDPWKLYDLHGDDDVDYCGGHIWVLIETLLDYAIMHFDPELPDGGYPR